MNFDKHFDISKGFKCVEHYAAELKDKDMYVLLNLIGTEINGASEPEALQLSIPLSSRLKNILLSSEEGILDFSGRRTS